MAVINKHKNNYDKVIAWFECKEYSPKQTPLHNIYKVMRGVYFYGL